MTPRDFLKDLDTCNIPHSGRSFYEHLCSVEDILKLCRCPEHVSLAGLFHSIYGTNFFNTDLKIERVEVQKVIGERAEYLAWLFCNAQRPFCWFVGNKIALRNGTAALVDDKTLHELRMIEGANLLEQQLGVDIIVQFTESNND
jgi:hypothetical protein